MGKKSKKKKKKKEPGKVRQFVKDVKESEKGGFGAIKEAAALIRMREFAGMCAAVAHRNSQYLMIFLDPKTDVFFLAHDDIQCPNRLLDEKGRTMGIIRKALEFNKETMKNDHEMNFLLGTISGAIDAMNKIKKENRDRKYKRIIKTEPKGMRKFKHYDQLKKHHDLEKMKKEDEADEELRIEAKVKKEDWDKFTPEEKDKIRRSIKGVKKTAKRSEDDSIREEQAKLDKEKVEEDNKLKE